MPFTLALGLAAAGRRGTVDAIQSAACLLVLLALAARADDSRDRPSFEMEQVIDLAALKREQAVALEGRRAVFLVAFGADTEEDEAASGCVMRDCLPSEPRISGLVILPSGARAGERAVVEGTLRIQRLPGFIGPAGPVPPMMHLVLHASRVR